MVHPNPHFESMCGVPTPENQGWQRDLAHFARQGVPGHPMMVPEGYGQWIPTQPGGMHGQPGMNMCFMNDQCGHPVSVVFVHPGPGQDVGHPGMMQGGVPVGWQWQSPNGATGGPPLTPEPPPAYRREDYAGRQARGRGRKGQPAVPVLFSARGRDLKMSHALSNETNSTQPSPRTLPDTSDLLKMVRASRTADAIEELLVSSPTDQQQKLLKQVIARAVELAFHPIGCRVVQKALSIMTPSQCRDLVREFAGHVANMSTNRHANHVVQKMVDEVDPSAMEFVVPEMEPVAVAVAKHKYGCRILQRVLLRFPRHLLGQLLQSTTDAPALVGDQFGHFVVEHIIEHHPDFRAKLMPTVLAEAAALGADSRTLPFVARVCERVLRCATEGREELLGQLRWRLLAGPGPASVEALAGTDHGAALLVAALPAASGEVQQLLVSRLQAMGDYERQKRVTTALRRMGVRVAARQRDCWGPGGGRGG